MGCWIRWSLVWPAAATQPTYHCWVTNLDSAQIPTYLMFIRSVAMTLVFGFAGRAYQNEGALNFTCCKAAGQTAYEYAVAGTTGAAAPLKAWEQA